jgi:hypothetical protein
MLRALAIKSKKKKLPPKKPAPVLTRNNLEVISPLTMHSHRTLI